MVTTCLLCDWGRADAELHAMEVWSDDLWRLTSRVGHSPVAGFSYLVPKRHIPHITDLDGVEAETFGQVLASVTSALRRATGAELVYANIFGERVAHLHVNLAPHSPGDALLGGPGLLKSDAPELPDSTLRQVAFALADALG